MEVKSIISKISLILKKYKYAVIILIIGIVLMMMPKISVNKADKQSVKQTPVIYENNINDDLKSILCKIDGVGRVEVMLTIDKGAETIYQSNTVKTVSDQTTDIKNDTVIITDSDRNEQGMIVRIDPVKYLGAVVICQGANNPNIRLSVVEAVSKITGLGTDRICVLKMK